MLDLISLGIGFVVGGTIIGLVDMWLRFKQDVEHLRDLQRIKEALDEAIKRQEERAKE